MKNKIICSFLSIFLISGCNQNTYDYSKTLYYFNENYGKIVLKDYENESYLSTYKYEFINDKKFNDITQERLIFGEDREVVLKDNHEDCKEILSLKRVEEKDGKLKIISCYLSVRMDNLGFKPSDEINSIRYDFINKKYYIANHLGVKIKEDVLSISEIKKRISKMEKHLNEYFEKTKTRNEKNMLKFLKKYIINTEENNNKKYK